MLNLLDNQLNIKNMKEVELLYKLDEQSLTIIRQKLRASFVAKIREIDTYFYPPNRDFLATDDGRENLRVRENENKKELTYKKVVYNHGIYSHSIENNLDIADAAIASEILKSLGFRIHMVLNKEREVFQEGNFHITIDNVKDLGYFIEIEWVGQDGDEDKIKQFCMAKAAELGLTAIQDKGYLRLLEEKNKQQ